MELSGNIFSGDHFFDWDYNDRNELTTADQFNGTPSLPGTRFTQYGDYDYLYDNIGNRGTYRLDSDPATTYTPNEFNQYNLTTYPAESFAYDGDGNLIADGQRTYGWDAENRLVEVTPLNPTNGAKKVRSGYDYLGRRVRKETYTYADGWPTNPGEIQHFVYDRWNVLLVMNGSASNQILRKYTWGLDLSGLSGAAAPGGIHGAGGISGLLACTDEREEMTLTLWYVYDANGNVAQVFDGTIPLSMGVAAKYEYDPYGDTIVATGTYASANPFRFSTKWFDAETALGYWGYRWYSPRLGRWMSRDPLGDKAGILAYLRSTGRTQFSGRVIRLYAELAGPNLLSSTANRPTCKWDSLGLWYSDDSETDVYGEVSCNPFGRHGLRIRISKKDPPCVRACTAVHEGVHVVASDSCCKRYQDAVRRLGSKFDVDDYLRLEEKWKDFRTRTLPAQECAASLASAACDTKKLTSCWCWGQQDALRASLRADLIQIRRYCSAMLAGSKDYSCPFE